MKFSPQPAGGPLLDELVGYLGENRASLQQAWVRRVTHARLLEPMAPQRIGAIADSLIDGYVASLAQGGLEGLRGFLGRLPEYLRPFGVSRRDAPSLAGLLRDVCGQSLFRQFRHYEGRRAESIPEAPVRPPLWPVLAPAFPPH